MSQNPIVLATLFQLSPAPSSAIGRFCRKRLVQAHGLAHSSLDVQRLDVLPVLLEQRDEEVDAQHHVSKHLVIVHLNMTNSDTQAKNFLKLELDGRTDFGDFVGEVFIIGDGGREFASFGETWTKETGDLLDEGFGRKEGVIFLSELLNKLLVLV